jgi:predicted NBD/HSP70 family sugar kinase
MTRRKASNIDVRKVNRINVIRAILACERISQPELTQQLEISWPTVLQNVKELIDLGLVEEVGAFASTGGRKARAFAPVKDAKLAIGIDITQNHIGLVLVNLAGDLITFTRSKKTFSMDDSYFRELGQAVDRFILSSGYEPDRVTGAGISLPGIISADGGVINYSHVLGLVNAPARACTKHIKYPCTLINDANAAGLAEMYGLSEHSNAVYLSLSNSVGGAILPAGGFYEGDNLRAGEFGHNTLYPAGKTCYCGKKGCVDPYCSARVLHEHTNGNLNLFFEKLAAGDDKLQEVWQDYLQDLSIVINNLRMTFDCDVIVGGYVGGFMEDYIYDLQQLCAKRNTFEQDASYLRLCKYKLEASAVGAALTGVEKYIINL